jgi:TonB-dependent receptor
MNHDKKTNTEPQGCSLSARINRASVRPLITSTGIASLILFLLTVFVPVMQAQTPDGKGAIAGRVINQATGRYLGDAAVRIAGTNIETVTDANGYYRISGVPAGEARISASYTDLDTATQTVTVIAGQTVSADLNLTAQVYELEKFVVAGAREGSARAVQEQHMSINQKSVFASDSFGNVVDSNIGELLKNIPGVTIDYDGEDAQSMRIRGMDPSLLNVTMDGNDLASVGVYVDGNTSRAFNLATQPLNNIDKIEVILAPLPSHSANTMGGSINLVSKNALQQKGRRIRVAAGLSLNTDELNFDKTPGGGRTPEYKIMPNFTLSWSEVFGSKRPIGIAFNASFNRSYRFNNRYDLPNGYTYDSTVLASNGNRVTPDTPGRVNSLSYTESGKSEQSRMLSLNLDWQVTPSTQLFLYSTWNDITGLGAYGRNMTVTAGGQTGEANLNTMISPSGASLGMGYAISAANTENISFNGGVRHKFGNLEIVYGAFYSRGETDPNPDENFSISYGYSSLGMRVDDVAGNGTGRITQTSPADGSIITADDPLSYLNYKNYNSLTFRHSFYYGTDERRGANIDITFPPFSAFNPSGSWSMPIEVKAGARFSEQLRTSHRYYVNEKLTGGGPSFGSAAEPKLWQFADPYFRNAWSFDVPIPNWLNPYYVVDYREAHPNEFYDDSLDKDGRIYQLLLAEKESKESTTAGYFMLTTRPLRTLTVTAGARYEYTKVSAEGPNYENPDITSSESIYGQGSKYDIRSQYVQTRDQTGVDVNGNPTYGAWYDTAEINPYYQMSREDQLRILFTRQRNSTSYDDWFPNLQLKWEPTRNLVVRFARTQAIGRPDFSNILPGDRWLKQWMTIQRSNPALRPERSEKYDFSAEYYFKKSNMLTLSLFRQNFTDTIQTLTSFVTNVHDPEAAGVVIDGVNYVRDLSQDEGAWMLEQKSNFGKGQNQGFEIAYKQRLDVLADWLRNFEVYGSFSYADPKMWIKIRTYPRPQPTDTDEEKFAYYNSPTYLQAVDMPGIQKRSATLQLHYFGNRFSGRIRAYRVDKYARKFIQPGEINYQDAYIRYDLNLNYRLSNRWTASLDWRNVTNEGDVRHIYNRTGGYYTSGAVINLSVGANF